MRRAAWILLLLIPFFLFSGNSQTGALASGDLPGFVHPDEELAVESRFLTVPNPKLAKEHLRILTQAPHVAGTPEDKANAEYVAKKFREAGLKTEIVEYNVLINYPADISVDVTAPADVQMHGPTREHVE